MADFSQPHGFLIVAVTTGSGTFPLPGAFVTISVQTPDGPVLYRIVRTDESGRTPTIALPAPAKSESTSPEQPTPYLSYNVRVDLKGYQPAIVRGISIFPNISSVLPISLAPLSIDQDEMNIQNLPPEVLNTDAKGAL